jgi:D-sedoheptulose 7-phosphate isomerase
VSFARLQQSRISRQRKKVRITGDPGLAGVLERCQADRHAGDLALAASAHEIAVAAQAMAERFRAGGRLLAFGSGLAAVDAQHVAVEFLHPVIVGTRALSAHALAPDGTPDDGFSAPLRALGTSRDIAIGMCLGESAGVTRGLRTAREIGMLTVVLAGGPADSPVACAADHPILIDTCDPLRVREALVTTYHVLWELVHVFLERPRGPEAT